MSERPQNPSDENNTPTGWHPPASGQAWQAPAAGKSQTVRRLKALPENLTETPANTGAWHLPRPEQTIYSTTDMIETLVDSSAPLAASLRPEDILAQIVGQPKPSAPGARPEDLVPRFERGTKAQPEAPADSMASLEQLGALDDDESVSMSELMAISSLQEQAQSGLPFDAAVSGVNPADLSPAERAIYGIQTPASEQATMMVEGATSAASQPSFDETRTLGSTGALAAQPQFTPEQIQLAEQFVKTRQQVQVLRLKASNGQIDRAELERALQEQTILDPQNNWWMIGVETDKWYRYDNATAQWVEQDPPVPLEAASPRTETIALDPRQVLPSTLPSTLDNPTTQREFSEYDQSVYAESQRRFSSQFGSQDTPIPNPDQPTVDPNMTMVSPSFDATTLTNAEPTLRNLNIVDARDFGATMPSASMQGGIQAPAGSAYESAPDYAYEGQVAPTFEDARQRERASLFTIVGLGLLGLLACGIISVIGFFGYSVYWYNQTVEPYRAGIAALANYQPDFQVARIYDANGDVIVELTGSEGARDPVSVESDQVSPYFVHAVIASEDPTFYENPGFNVLSIGRAFFQNLFAGQVESGASTITQQIARNLILQDTTVSAERKITELLIALEIAETYSKNQILDIYINEFFFGNNSYGIEAAAKFYFNKSAADLNMAEAAMLAGILPSPSATNPVANRVAAFENMRVVMDRMVRTGCLSFQHGIWAANNEAFCVSSDTIVDDGSGNQTRLFTVNSNGTYGGLLATQMAIVETRNYAPRGSETPFPHFVNFVVGQVEATYGPGALYQRGFNIYTTIVPRIQRTAEGSLRQGVTSLQLNGAETGSVLVYDVQTGAIRALVGSPDFNNEEIDGQVDNTRTYQQPGSAIKPILYTAALANISPSGYLTPASVLWDVPSQYNIDGQMYAPVNFDRQTRGPVPLRFALQQSLNIPAVKTFEFIGQQAFIDMARALGINFLPEATYGLPSALGANEVRLMDLVHAYGTLANDGRHIPLFAIERITESVNGQEVEVPLPARQEPYQAVSPQVAYLMQNILSDDVARSATFNGIGSTFGANGDFSGTAFGLPNQGYVAAKTGTTNDNRDLWTVGFTNNWAIGVWIGTVDNQPMTGNVTSLSAASVWRAVMTEALAGRNPGQFELAGGIRQDTVCRLTGTLAAADSSCPERVTELYIEGQAPTSSDQGFVQTLNIDSWTGLRANQWCQENLVAQTFANIRDPFAVNWLTTTATGQQLLGLLGLPNNLSAAPQGECAQGQALPTIRLNFPTTGSVATGDLVITGQISAPDLQRWELQLAPAGSDSFSPITQANTQQILTAGTQLTSWNSRSVTNGTYTLRLAAYSASGGYIFRDVQITVENVLPTATPVPTQAASPTVPAFTPLPFESSSSGPATPTATIDPLG
jgi:membrane peptidoglycan carboxypeptidase